VGAFTLRISNLTNADVGNYTFEVTVNGASVFSGVSQAVSLSLGSAAPPVISTQPQVATIVALGGAAVFSVVATGVPAPTYQWQKDGSAIVGASDSTYRISFANFSSAGVYKVTVSNASGSVVSNSAEVFVGTAQAPSIFAQPANVAASLGGAVSFSVTASILTFPPPTYQWYQNGAAISGANGATLSVAGVSTSSEGTYTVVLSNLVGSVTSNAVRLTIAPTITVQPTSVTVNAGASATFTVSAAGSVPLTYQWSRSFPANLSSGAIGATSATLTVPNVTASDAGSYLVRVTNSAGSVTTSGAVLTVTFPNPARLINLSILTSLDAGDTFTMGFVVGGSGTSGSKPLLIRAAGPSLAQFGVTGPHSDPKIEFFTGANKVNENDDWGGVAAISNAFAQVGAFAYISAASKDAAIFDPAVARGDNSVRVSGVGSASGTVIAELYEASPAASVTSTTSRLVNVSVLKNIGTGLTAGFVIGGNGSKTVLIRAVGPALTNFGVANALANPRLTLFNSSGTVIGGNDDWSVFDSGTMTSVGAFSLPLLSRDAAFVTTLAPGNYTVQVSGVGGTTGVALVEIYEVP